MTAQSWYYAENGNVVGPLPETGLEELLAQGRITPETMIRTEGETEWMPLGRSPGFSQSPYTPPAVPGDDGISWDDHIPSGPQVRPWIRYWARSFDIALAAVVFGVVFEWINPHLMEMPDTLFGILLTGVIVPIEAVLLSVFGTTPFKALMNVRVRNRDGTKLDFSQAMTRALNVWIRGMGLGIPLVTLITNYTSYKRLNDQGSTSWDADGPHVVSHRIMAWWRVLLVWGIIIGVIALVALAVEGGQ